ncbi:MAG: sensor histidine kinase [Pseudomonadota bacterium]
MIVAFVGGAVYTGWEIMQLKTREEIERSTIDWTLWQAEHESDRLLMALDRYELGDPSASRSDVTNQFEILWGRLSSLHQGPEGGLLVRLPGAQGAVADMISQLEATEPAIFGLERDDQAGYRAIRARIEGLGRQLHRLEVSGIQALNHRYTKSWLSGFERELFLFLVGTVAIGIVLVSWLVWVSRRAETMRIVAEGAERRTAATNEELKKTAARLQRALGTAAAANEAKNQFLANMSHELRTPLNAIIGFAEAMEHGIGGALNAKHRQYVRDIRESGTHLLRIISDILDLSRLDAGRIDLQEELADPREVIEAALRITRAQAEKAGLRLMIEAADLPKLRCDPVRVRQILLNLISNALKFTEPGGEVRIAAFSRNGQFTIAVSDTGIGIAPEDIPRALEPFGQIDSGLARRYDGTGLGLPLAKRLAECHGGSLHLTSQVGVGTTVSATFPAERVVHRGNWQDKSIGDGEVQVAFPVLREGDAAAGMVPG